MVAIWLAVHYSSELSGLLSKYIDNQIIRVIVVMAMLVLIVMILSNLLKNFILWVLDKSGLISFDRILGGIFGFLRGVFITMLLVQLLMIIGVNDKEWWKKSVTVKPLNNIAQVIPDYLPSPFSYWWRNYFEERSQRDNAVRETLNASENAAKSTNDAQIGNKQPDQEVEGVADPESMLKTDVDDFVEFVG